MKRIPFRIGTTSYILPADILPNVRYLAGRVDDVELVLFEVEDGGSNLPDESVLAQLAQIAVQYDLTYTVHLPLDLRFGDDDLARERSQQKALQVIARTRALQPYAYILHVDGRSVRGEFHSQRWEEWRRRTHRALEEMLSQVDEPELLAVENLDGYAPEFWDEVLEGLPLSRCLDLGHLWYDGHDPLPYLRQHIAQTRVLHIHGHAERDHQSLKFIPRDELRRVIDFLISSGFTGVFTMEIFGEDDFHSSCESSLDVLHEMNLEVRWENH